MRYCINNYHVSCTLLFILIKFIFYCILSGLHADEINTNKSDARTHQATGVKSAQSFVGVPELFTAYDTHGILQHHDAITGSELQHVADGNVMCLLV